MKRRSCFRQANLQDLFIHGTVYKPALSPSLTRRSFDIDTCSKPHSPGSHHNGEIFALRGDSGVVGGWRQFRGAPAPSARIAGDSGGGPGRQIDRHVDLPEAGTHREIVDRRVDEEVGREAS